MRTTINLFAIAFTCGAALLAASPARAFIYGGNPELHFRVDRPAHDITSAEVTVDKVRVHLCGAGSKDYPVADTYDLANEDLVVTVEGGSICAVTLYWSSDMLIEGQNGSSWFVDTYEETHTIVDLDETVDPVPLAPRTTVWGTFYGGSPKIYTSVE